MSEIATKTLPVEPFKKTSKKKLKPARKQVKPGDVVKTEAVQTGKEYSTFPLSFTHTHTLKEEKANRGDVNRYLV